jgi:hypothetical protein
MKKFSFVALGSLAILVSLPTFAVAAMCQSSCGLSYHHASDEHFLCKLEGSGIVEDTYIAPPASLKLPTRFPKNVDERQALDAYMDEELSIFTVTFEDAVPEEARTPVRYALLIWQQYITTPRPMNVRVGWANDPEESYLASASPGDFELGDFFDEGKQLLEPIGIYKKKNNTDSFGADIRITINGANESELYYGIDGNCPNNRYDLATIILHEVGHGLGFVSGGREDTSDATQALGELGFGSSDQMAYLNFDPFLETFEGNELVNSELYPESSVEMYAALTSNRLFFAGPLATAANGGFRPRIYAPTTFNSGSSISHLNEFSFLSGDPNSLMTPRVGLGEVNHDPGPVTVAILGDMGWDFVRIVHQESKDTENLELPIRIITAVESDSPIEGNPTLFYKLRSAETYSELEMTYDEPSTLYFADIPATGTVSEFDYYIQVIGSGSRVFTAPSNIDSGVYSFLVGPDTTAPVITHTPDDYLFSNVDVYRINYQIEDNLGLSSIQTDIWLDGNPQTPLSYEPQPGETEFFTDILFSNLTGVESLEYQFTATDTALAANQTVAPATGRYSVSIETIRDPLASFVVNFDGQPEADVILEGFEVKQSNGFSSQYLGTPHPYQDNNIQYFAYLRQQILVGSNTTLSFDEIVLVEPGEEGTSFGDDQFWDYVIVEFSKDNGNTWSPLLDGYDSDSNPSWLQTYNSEVLGGDSTAVGDPTLFVRRDISLNAVEGIDEADTLMIRFRLFSDPATVGWGWAIDNLAVTSQ